MPPDKFSDIRICCAESWMSAPRPVLWDRRYGHRIRNALSQHEARPEFSITSAIPAYPAIEVRHYGSRFLLIPAKRGESQGNARINT